MIALAVGMAAMAAITAGIMLEYASEAAQSQMVREEANSIQADRVRELVRARYDSGAVSIENLWSSKSVITGIVTICDDGTILRASAHKVLHAGISDYMDADIDSMRGRCP